MTAASDWDAHLSISPTPVNRLEPVATAGQDAPYGAFVRFEGVVRGTESGRLITGIEYSAYQPMAEKTLNQMADHGRRQFDPHHLRVHHVIGFVAAGVPSVVIEVGTPHSAPAFEICQWYLAKLKTTVPIWKEPIYA